MSDPSVTRSGFFRILVGIAAAVSLAFPVGAQQADKAASERRATPAAPPAADPQAARERCIAERRVDCDDPSIRARELDPTAVPPPPRVRPDGPTPPPTGPKPSPR